MAHHSFSDRASGLGVRSVAYVVIGVALFWTGFLFSKTDAFNGQQRSTAQLQQMSLNGEYVDAALIHGWADNLGVCVEIAELLSEKPTALASKYRCVD